ncbi:PepSY-associated TM helix domain-containing protein [uncultured Tenacibaculum sp.]|uniref:PepSY-associated TM helix domain-containing protein n=1 Tax=uncultured Tenacibaculum sp. TaxID=174713 RepID=UPI00261ABEE9|nr:PepSY-associated TM helix domain-containing protein [uncultured Tenacibaculum sp.]
MNKRIYNVFFHTHTVSGIVISVALYIIFFAGAFALFKDEIEVWEEGKSITHTERKNIDYDKLFATLDEDYDLTGRDLQINLGKHKDKIYVSVSPSQDTISNKKAAESQYFSIDIHTEKRKEYHEYYGVGEFLYRLHFFHQIPTIGIYLAGFVALFFLFAIVTGVIVHWKKIVSNFYSFNPKIALKRVWTDAHTALGVIGLPFQFIFAVTGAYFCLSILVLIPANFLYNGDQTKLLEDIRPERKTYVWEEKNTSELPSFNEFIQKSDTIWEDFHFTSAFIRNYEGSNMRYVLQGELHDKDRFVGIGRTIYNQKTGTIEIAKNPEKLNYVEDVQLTLGRLHFGSFGGFLIKTIYFILALITCFVIISGVLIWVEARNKKSMTVQQRLYTAKVGHTYLAICLSMLPVTALSFLFIKIFGQSFANLQTAIYACYFILWFVAILYLKLKKDNYKVNKISLLLGGIFGLLIPIANGIVSGQWIWNSFINNQKDFFIIDFLWLCIGSISLLMYSRISEKVKSQSAFTKTPIDYKEAKKELEEQYKLEQQSEKSKDKNFIPMRTKIIMLWIFLVIGFIIHHVYGIADVYFKESLLLEGANGETPEWAHQWRILLEGIAFVFAVLTVQISKQWFKWTSLIWAIILGLFNIYHFITAVIYEFTNVSEILVLFLMVITSMFLIKELIDWKSVINSTAKE